MRRLAAALLCVFASVGLAGCIGPDGQKAESLLTQAEQAQAAVTSEHFIIRFDIDAEGHTASMDMEGGAYMKGANAGDFYFTATGSGMPGMSALNMVLVRRGGSAWLKMGGQTQQIPLPQAQQQFGSPTSYLDLARYVKSVSVGSSTYDGRPADRIVGTLDTHALLSSAGGPASAALAAAGVHVGDIRAVLFIPRDTHLVEVMFADFTVKAEGRAVHMHMSIAGSDVDKPFTIPQV